MHELLAPVGNSEMLEAAIDGGADAVYLSGPKYGARAAKANFELVELEQVVLRAHLMGVKVYLTVNTLIREAERRALYDYLDVVVALGVDAVIAQDLCAIDYLQSCYPELPVHGSTQLSIYNYNGLKNAQKLGLARVVVARELTLANLQTLFSDDLPEIEVFAHGAMCYAFSGACLLSSFNGGRSGNRGQCAQSCRLKYRADWANGHLLSMRDLATIERIKTLLNYPIATFKIEGRLRSADYVYHTVLAYRRALDGTAASDLQPYIDNMKLTFNRSYSSGYLWSDKRRLNSEQASNLGEQVGTVVGQSGKYHQKIKLTRALRPGDAIKFGDSGQLGGTEIFNIYHNRTKIEVGRAGQVININYRKALPIGTKVYRTRSAALTDLRQMAPKKQLPISMQFSVAADYRIRLIVNCQTSGISVEQLALAEPAVKRPTDRSTIVKQLTKLGDTPYQLVDCKVSLAVDSYIAIKQLNQLRRAALADLSARRTARPTQRKRPYQPTINCLDIARPPIICKVNSAAQYRVLKDYDVALFADKLSHQNWSRAAHFWRPFSRYQNLPSTEQMVSGLAQIDCAKQNILDEHSQIYNVAAYDRLQRLGATDITLSPEIGRAEAEQLANLRPFRIFGYGKLALMYAATCPKREAGQDCATCSKTFRVAGDRLAAMQVYCHDQILAYQTAQPVVNDWAWRRAAKLPLLLSFSDEDAATTARVIEAVLNGAKLALPAERGNFAKV